MYGQGRAESCIAHDDVPVAQNLKRLLVSGRLHFSTMAGDDASSELTEMETTQAIFSFSPH